MHLHAVARDEPAFRRALDELRSIDRDLARDYESYWSRIAEHRAWVAVGESPAEIEYRKGRLAEVEWRYDDARRHYSEQLARSPDHVGALCGRARALLEDPDSLAEDIARSLADARAAVDVSGRRDPEALWVLADVSYRRGDAESARRIAVEVEELGREGVRVSDAVRERLRAYLSTAR